MKQLKAIFSDKTLETAPSKAIAALYHIFPKLFALLDKPSREFAEKSFGSYEIITNVDNEFKEIHPLLTQEAFIQQMIKREEESDGEEFSENEKDE